MGHCRKVLEYSRLGRRVPENKKIYSVEILFKSKSLGKYKYDTMSKIVSLIPFLANPHILYFFELIH